MAFRPWQAPRRDFPTSGVEQAFRPAVSSLRFAALAVEVLFHSQESLAGNQCADTPIASGALIKSICQHDRAAVQDQIQQSVHQYKHVLRVQAVVLSQSHKAMG